MTDEDGCPGPVGLLGRGVLRDAIASELDGRVAVAPPSTDGLAMLVTATDAWDLGGHPAARTLASGRVPWLPVRSELGAVIIGPREEPGRPGCVDCAETRRRVRADHAEREAVRRAYPDQLATRPSSWLTSLAARLAGVLVRDEAERPLPRTRGAFLRLDLAQLRVARHPFLADPACPVCGGLPDDSRELARVVLSARPVHQPGSYRVRDGLRELDRLTETLVDPEAGVISGLFTSSDGGVVRTTAPTGLRTGFRENGYGRAPSFRASKLTALLEALERYGATPGARRTVVEASYQEVREQALDPRALGLHTDEQHRQPGFRFQPYSPDCRYRWVWGWSFARQEPLLVPERCGYYQLGPHPDEGHGFVYEISNGCALGGCLEEAILYGILEVAERDAFLLTWYARLPAPEVDLASSDDPIIPLQAAAVRAETGYRVRVFDITMEQGIPAVWAMAVNPADDGRPALICAAGAHPDPRRAIRGALAELCPSVSGMIRYFADPGRAAAARAMVADPELVREMADHSLLYADPRAAARLDFLTGSRGTRRVSEIGAADRGGFAGDDLAEQLREAVRRYTDHGLDVVVVDQTTAEHQVAAMHCVKVLIPGTLSMTFGHRYRRITGLPRLYEVPYQLGYRHRPLRPDEVNPHPHPFP